MTARLSRTTSVQRLLSLAAQQIRAVTGYDRVMVYQFQADYTGVVVAEALRSGLDPYLGLHYRPLTFRRKRANSSDASRCARSPMCINTPVPVLPANATDQPLDLTLSQLRSASPVHIEYLRNMGSAATLTISIMRGDALWA